MGGENKNSSKPQEPYTEAEALAAGSVHKALGLAELPQHCEESLATRFSDKHSEDFKYAPALGWLHWSGQMWRLGGDLETFSAARALVREIALATHDEGANEKFVGKIASASTVAATERLARADRRHWIQVEHLDADPLLLGTPGGTVDLVTGELRPPRREELITKSVAIAPASGKPTRWLELLDVACDGDRDLVAFLQRFFGYTLTGSIDEQCFAFFYGSGANGKSTIVGTMTDLLRDYATIVPSELLMETQGVRHPTYQAALRGARLAAAQEIDEGQRWALAKIKGWTGGEAITAGQMRRDPFTFTPKFKLLFSGNHRPSLRAIDEAIRRRMLLVPFTVTIPPEKRDPGLRERLRAEWPQILAWAIEGCREWRLGGLQPPLSVTEATDSYLDAEDVLGHWLQECCEQERPFEAITGELHRSYVRWSEKRSERALGIKRFSQALEERGLERCQLSGGTRGFRGLRLLAEELKLVA